MKRSISVNQLLMLNFAFICLLVVLRLRLTDSLQFLFLIWNIFLAWIPYATSNYFAKYRSAHIWKQLILFSSWLLFFPNALYIVTDLIHLREVENVPAWFDAILLFSAAFMGLVMAFLSLHNAERFLRGKFSEKSVAIMIPAIIFVASFGVYLGRFGRWNSWDVIQSPISLALHIAEAFFFPHEHLHTWAITSILAILFSLIYAFYKRLHGAIPK